MLPGFLTMDELEEGNIPAELEEFLQDGEPPILITGSTGKYLKKGFRRISLPDEVDMEKFTLEDAITLLK